MKRGVRYSLAVYLGLLFAGFLHQPIGQVYSTGSASHVYSTQVTPSDPTQPVWAKPLDCEAEAVKTLDLDASGKRTAPVAIQPRHPQRNPFR